MTNMKSLDPIQLQWVQMTLGLLASVLVIYGCVLVILNIITESDTKNADLSKQDLKKNNNKKKRTTKKDKDNKKTKLKENCHKKYEGVEKNVTPKKQRTGALKKIKPRHLLVCLLSLTLTPNASVSFDDSAIRVYRIDRKSPPNRAVKGLTIEQERHEISKEKKEARQVLLLLVAHSYLCV